jgi:hypothetical protein
MQGADREDHRMTRILLFALALLAPPPALAFDRVADRAGFVALVQGRTLTALGVALRVLPEGRIEGRAFGADVTGRWQWRDGFFCRELFAAGRSYPLNCQTVAVEGGTLRFVADEGTGDRAELRLR